MPIYEFFSPDNNRIYSFFARSLAYAGTVPRCPDNPKFRMERMISSFSFTGRAKEKPAPGAAGEPDDPNLDAAISEIEREAGVVDPDNPDPRQVARLMRTMTKMTGEKMPEQMEEMMRRLEGGESLEKLEDEFSSVMDEVGSTPSEEEALVREGQLENIRERLRAARQRPERDPILYEMSEFVDQTRASPAKDKGRGGPSAKNDRPATADSVQRRHRR